MENVDEIIGRNLSMLRGEVSQEELANRMRDAGYSWTKMTVYNIERGERQMRLAEAVDVLRCLGRNPMSDIGKLLVDDSTAHVLDLSSQLLNKNNDIIMAVADLGRLRIELARQYVLFTKNTNDEEKQTYGDLLRKMVTDYLRLTSPKELSNIVSEGQAKALTEAISNISVNDDVYDEDALKTLVDSLGDFNQYFELNDVQE